MYRVELSVVIFVDGASDDEHAIESAHAHAESMPEIYRDVGTTCQHWPYSTRGVVIKAGKKKDEEG